MDVIEFLKKTERKNIQNFIGVKVKNKLIEYENTLKQRRRKLKDILEIENLQHNEELALLAKEKLNEQVRKRLDWITTKSMERIQAEEELLEVKRQQRELENCEAWRHFQSRQLLLDSKKGQLYQIEDKRLRIGKEKQIDRMWHDVMQRLAYEREYKEIYGKELLKATEQTNQFINKKIDDFNKKWQEQEDQRTKNEFRKENRKALLMEETFRKDEQRKEFFNKNQQYQMLKSQISTNCDRKTLETELLLQESRLENDIQKRKIFAELEQNERVKVYNNEWQKCYLTKSFEEKQQQVKEEKELDRMYLSTGCVLQQSSKNPYRESTR